MTDQHFGDQWGIAGRLGYAAAKEAVGSDDLAALAKWAFRVEEGLIRFGTQEELPGEVLAETTEGWLRSLLGHGAQRKLNKANRKDRGGVEWFLHQDAPSDLAKKKVKVTRAILPNWVSKGELFPVEMVSHLWFAPLAATALPLKAGAVIVAAIAFDRVAEVCRAIQPQSLADCVPASAADALLCARERVGDLARVVAWHFDWSQANKRFREVRAILRDDLVTDKAMEFWSSFASNVPPLEGEHGLFPDKTRGLVADNLVAGRRPYDGFTDKLGDQPLHHLRRGSQALLRAMGGEDWLQDKVIARAAHLGLTAYAIAKATGGKVSEDHIQAYLTRKKSMGSHKLQHVLTALGLQVALK